MKMGGFTVRTVFGLDSRGFTTFSHGQSKSSIVIMASPRKSWRCRPLLALDEWNEVSFIDIKYQVLGLYDTISIYLA